MEGVTVFSGRQAGVLDARRGSTIPPESSDLDPPAVGIGNFNTPIAGGLGRFLVGFNCPASLRR